MEKGEKKKRVCSSRDFRHKHIRILSYSWTSPPHCDATGESCLSLPGHSLWGESPLHASGCTDSRRPCPEELKSLFIRTRLKLSGEMAQEMAHSLPVPAVGLWWRVQQAEMCPCWLLLDSIYNVKKKKSSLHFVKVLCLHCPKCASLIFCIKETSKKQFFYSLISEDKQWSRTRVCVSVFPPCWALLPIKARTVSPPAAALHHSSGGQHLLWQRWRRGGRCRHHSSTINSSWRDLYWPLLAK